MAAPICLQRLPDLLKIAFYQPDIAANLGAGLRLAACFGLGVEIVEPCGFPLDDRRLKRVGMDYAALASMSRHTSFARFSDAMTMADRRIVLLSRHADSYHDDFVFQPRDVLLVGRESAGVPDDVAAKAEARLKIPMVEGVRSLNVITALAMVAGEALRQTGQFDAMKRMEQI